MTKRRQTAIPLADYDPSVKAIAAVTALVNDLPVHAGLKVCLAVAQALAMREGMMLLSEDIEKLAMRAILGTTDDPVAKMLIEARASFDSMESAKLVVADAERVRGGTMSEDEFRARWVKPKGP